MVACGNAHERTWNNAMMRMHVRLTPEGERFTFAKGGARYHIITCIWTPHHVETMRESQQKSERGKQRDIGNMVTRENDLQATWAPNKWGSRARFTAGVTGRGRYKKANAAAEK